MCIHIGLEWDSNPRPLDNKLDSLPTEIKATRLSDSRDFPVNPVDKWSQVRIPVGPNVFFTYPGAKHIECYHLLGD